MPGADEIVQVLVAGQRFGSVIVGRDRAYDRLRAPTETMAHELHMPGADLCGGVEQRPQERAKACAFIFDECSAVLTMPRLDVGRFRLYVRSKWNP